MDKELIDARNKAYEEHHQRFTCPHPSKELRRQVIADGSTRYIYQCLSCGHAQGQSIKKETAFDLTAGCEPSQFDLALKDAWDNREKSELKRIEQDYLIQFKNKATEFWKIYDAYLETDEWQGKRQKVISRAQGLCEGCQEQPAQHVHHLSYEHIGNEFLFELVALCKACHERIHAENEGK